MQRTEVLKLMSIMKLAYPNWASKLDDESVKGMVDLWSMLFVDDDANLITTSVMAIIKTDPSPFPPTPGAITQKAHELSHKPETTPVEAWGYVTKALGNSIHNSKGEWEKLPQSIKSFVSPSELKQWAQIDASVVQTVIASNFMRSYSAQLKTDTDIEMLPNGMKKTIESVKNHLVIESNNL